MRQTYKSMVAELSERVEEIFPWDLVDELDAGATPLLLDIRCPGEFDLAHLPASINVPRGILEIAVDYGYEETEADLVQARERRVVVICRSGKRSVLAAHTLQSMGYTNVASLRTGVRGWNDYEQPLLDRMGRRLDPDRVDDMLAARVADDQLGPRSEVA